MRIITSREGTLFGIAAYLFFTGCAVPPSDEEIVVDAPSEASAQWVPVENYLDHRCGSLDCHGSIERNFITYGCYGLRLDSKDTPGCPPGPNRVATTPDEYNLTFRSLVGLEPAAMSAVVSSGGRDPDILTFVRKARGEQAHKGGALIVPGDSQDLCVTSWLAGDTNTSACDQAIKLTQ